LVAKYFDLKLKPARKEVRQKDGSVRLEVTFSKEQWQKITRAQELLSNSLPDDKKVEVMIEYLCDKVIQQKGKTSTQTKNWQMASNAKIPNRQTETKGIQSAVRKAIPQATQRELFSRQKSCQ